MTKKVVLINPCGTPTEVLCPPMGLAFIASYARQAFPDYIFRIYDFEASKISMQKQVEGILSEQPDVIGMTALTATFHAGLKLAKEIKRFKPEIPVIMGGVHVTAMKGASSPYIDCSILGEGEAAFVEVLKMLEEGHPLPGIHTADLLKDIDHIPAWDLIDFSLYRWFAPFKRARQAVVYWSRGCPFDCVFCSNAVWRFKLPRVRYRTPESIIRELTFLKDNYGIEEVYVFDDEINTNPKWLLRVSEEIIKNRIHIFWKCQMRASRALVSVELLEKMKAAGCWQAAWGLESGDNDVLKGIRKKVTAEEIYSSLMLARDAGIIGQGLFMLGNIWVDGKGLPDGESREQILKTIDFAKKLRDKGLLEYVQFNIATPYPGSEMWDIVKRFELFVGDIEDWRHWGMDTHSITFRHPRLTSEEIAGLHQKAYKEFAFSPALLFKHILRVRKFSDVTGLLRSAGIVLRILFLGHPRKRIVREDKIE